MKNIRKMLLSALSVLLAIALAPAVAPPAAGADEPGQPDVVYPLRDAAYYAEHFPGVAMGSISDSVPVDPSEAPAEMVPLGVEPLKCAGDGYYAQELMVSTVTGLPDEAVPDIMAPLGDEALLLRVTGNMQTGLGVCIRLGQDASLYDAAEILRADERVVDVARSFYIEVDDATPSAVAPTPEAALEASYDYARWIMSVKAPWAWELLPSAVPATEIAVIDSGLDESHAASDLIPVDVRYAHSVVGGQPYNADDTGHGTAVAAAISSQFSYPVGGGFFENVRGISNGMKILPIKASHGGEFHWSDLECAYDYLIDLVTNKGVPVRVLNMSYGGGEYIERERQLLEILALNGVVLVAAAGNDSSSDDFFPAAYEGVVGVSALHAENDAPADFTNHGLYVDLSAPGVGIMLPNASAGANSYVSWKGTSFASPIVAGVAGLLLWEHPEIGAEEAVDILASTAVDVRDPNTGDGLNVGWDEYTGYGKVDAYAALTNVTTLRVAGSTRYETAALAARYAAESADTVIVASGMDANFPDALSASGLSGLFDAPVLKTAPDELSPAAADAIACLGASKVIVVGGTASVSARVESALAALPGVSSVDRVAGADRYDTSVEVYRYALGHGKEWSNPDGYARPQYLAGHEWKNPSGKRMAILVTGLDFPDALSASTLSAYGHYPVFLVGGDSLPASVEQALSEGNFDELLVMGGTAAIPKAVAQRAAAAVSPARLRSGAVNWYWSCNGSTRYETASLVAYHSVLEGMQTGDVLLASGRSSADATSAALFRSPLLLVDPSDVSQASWAGGFAYRNAAGVSRVIALGGDAAVPDEVLECCTKNARRGRAGDDYASAAGEQIPAADSLRTES